MTESHDTSQSHDGGDPIRDSTRATSGSRGVAHDAFRRAYDTHFGYVCHTLRRLGVRHADMEDLAHEVFVRVHAKWSDRDEARPLRPWLFGFCYRLASDYRKRAHVRREHFGIDAGEIAGGPAADRDVQAREQRELVLQALEAIQLDRRAVFVMHDIDEIPVPEIALTLELPLNTAYSRLRLARGEFRAAVRALTHKDAP